MKRLQTLVLLVAIVIIPASIVGAANDLDLVEENKSHETTVVFMRSAFVGAAIKASVYEVTDGETIFIGILKNNSKVEYGTTKGKHTFMVVSEAADFMEAHLDEGKTYYSIVTPRAGAWKARFSMFPVRNDGTTKFNTGSKKFGKWKKKTKLVSISEKSLAWFSKHKEDIEQKKAAYWEVWKQKTAEALAERTLNQADGM